MRKIGMVCGLGASLALAGCAGFDVAKAKGMTPKDEAFAKALHAGYVQFGQHEYDERDMGDADRFARRAITAASGQHVDPENLSERNLPPEMVGPLGEARDRLMAALDDGGRTLVPELAAQAQTQFDCWMEEQEENFQVDDIARCRNGFEAAMAEIAKRVKPLPVPPTVLFELGSDKLTSEGRKAIEAIATAYREHQPGSVLVDGHTDRAGTNDRNAALSMRRADAVAKGLKAAGVPDKAVAIEFFGEERPKVQTADNIPEQRNRRVEVLFQR